MKDKKKKELEAKWLKLIGESRKPEKSNTTPLQAIGQAKVIRRRKGNPDLHIAESTA